MTDSSPFSLTSDIIVEVAGTDLEFRPLVIADKTLTGRQLLAAFGATPIEEFIVIQWLPSGDFEELRPDEVFETRQDTPARFLIAKTDRVYRLILNDRSVLWPEERISERALRNIGRIDKNAALYLERTDTPDEEIKPDSVILLEPSGVEKVYSRDPEWKLNVQGVVIAVQTPVILARDAIREAGFDPDQGWIIVFKTRDGKNPVGLDDQLDLRLPGIEKLRLTPKEINNGDSAPAVSREFGLLEEDERGLSDRELVWETVIEGGRRWLLLKGYRLPPGYQVKSATIAVEIPSNYPAAELDMFYCHPFLSKADGHPIPQTQARQDIRGVQHQRWSRHRGGASRWIPGKDNVLTHLTLIDAAIAREVEK